VNLRECSPDVLHKLAGWFREVADLLEHGAELKEQHEHRP
jgi:hypothetical protein